MEQRVQIWASHENKAKKRVGILNADSFLCKQRDLWEGYGLQPGTFISQEAVLSQPYV